MTALARLHPRAVVARLLLGVPKSVSVGMAMSVINRFATVGLSFCATVLLARWLGAEDYGTYAFALSLIAVLGRLASMGAPALIIRTTAATPEAERAPVLRGLLLFGLGVGLTMSTLIALGYLVVTGADPREPDFWASPITWAVVLMLPLNALKGNLSAVLNGLGRIGETIWLDEALRLALYLAALLTAVLLLGLTANSLLALQMAVLSAVLLALILVQRMVHALRHARGQRGLTWKGRTWLKATASIGIIGLMMGLQEQADILMLKWLATATDVGLYHVASRSANLLTFFLAGVVIPLSPLIARAHASGEREELARTCRAATLLALTLTAAPALGLVLFGQFYLKTVFGDAYVAAAIALAILAVAQVIKVSLGVGGTLLRMTGNHNHMFSFTIGALVINVAGNAILIPHFAASGAAAATGLSIVVMAVWQHRTLKRVLGINSLSFSAFGRSTP